MKKIFWLIIIIMMIIPLMRGETEKDKATILIQKTIKEMGGPAFLKWTDYYGDGRFYIIKGSRKSWTKFWEEYKWNGKSRINFDKKREAISEIYNMDLGKGWSYEYGKVKEKSEDDIQRFRLAEKRNLANLFRERWKEDGMKVFYLGPGNFDTVKPLEALEFVDADNYIVTVFYEEGSSLPFKIAYKERNKDGIVLYKEEQVFRWFKIKGIQTPLRVEFYTNGEHSGLLEYSEFLYNVGLSDALFQKPSPKEK